MKKKIFNYEQVKLLNADVDLKELLILDYIAHFKNTGKMDEHILENKSWNWITPNKIAEDLPILGLKKEAIRNILKNYLGTKPKNWDERFEKFSDSMKKKAKNYKFLGFIEFRNICDEELGDKLVFRFTQKWFNLISEECETSHLAPKKANKKVVSSPQTNNSKEDLAQSSNKKDINSISQNKEYIQDESNVILKIDQKTHENFRILQSSGIKYIPYEKQEQFILSLDIEILKLAINITIEKAQKPNWNYLISTYEDLKNKNVSSNTEKFSKDVVDFNNKNRFHNFEETFTKYTEEEFEDIILKSQKKKFG